MNPQANHSGRSAMCQLRGHSGIIVTGHLLGSEPSMVAGVKLAYVRVNTPMPSPPRGTCPGQPRGVPQPLSSVEIRVKISRDATAQAMSATFPADADPLASKNVVGQQWCPQTDPRSGGARKGNQSEGQNMGSGRESGIMRPEFEGNLSSRHEPCKCP